MASDPLPDELNWEAPTRPRKPRPSLLSVEPPKPETDPATPWRLAAPLAVIFGFGALGVVVALFAVLIVRAQMVPVTVIVSADARQTFTRAATVAVLLEE